MNAARFVTFDIITRTCCAILFIVIPTYNIRPDITGEDIFSCVLRFLYKIDAADNLFPSIHCLVSWNCYIGVRNIKEYPVIFKNMAAVIAVMVFISTLVTNNMLLPMSYQQLRYLRCAGWLLTRQEYTDFCSIL